MTDFYRRLVTKTFNELDILVYLLSDWIPAVFCGKKHLAQLLYGRPLVATWRLLAEVGPEHLIMGLSLVPEGVWTF